MLQNYVCGQRVVTGSYPPQQVARVFLLRGFFKLFNWFMCKFSQLQLLILYVLPRSQKSIQISNCNRDIVLQYLPNLYDLQKLYFSSLLQNCNRMDACHARRLKDLIRTDKLHL